MCLCQRSNVGIIAAQGGLYALSRRKLCRLGRCCEERLRWASVSNWSWTRLRAMHPWGVSGWVWCSPDARRTWLIWLRLDLLAMIPGSCPTRLKVADATVLITILCWPDGWPHGADSV